jgi:hypothetical protein
VPCSLRVYIVAVAKPADPDEILLRCNRLIRGLLSGRIDRNTFQPWEIEMLLDIHSCQITKRAWDGVLRRYQRAIQRQIEKGATAPMKLSEFLASKH